MFIEGLYESLLKNGSNNAFCIKDEFYPYSYLMNKAALIQFKLTNDVNHFNNNRIALICTDDILTYSALLGVWFLGYAYVPLGLHNPPERNLAILKDANVKTILTTQSLDKEIYKDFRVINLSEIGDSDGLLQRVPVEKDQLAYILFTSGSTGSPKGVPISFGNLNSFLEAFAKSPVKIDAEDKCLQMFELTFDVSISSFLPALIKGACVYTIPNEVIKYLHVLKLIIKYRLTVIQIVPSVIRLSLPLLNKLNLPSVKYCILTGEATSIELFTMWKNTIPLSKIFNYYGPTEATIYCSYYDCNNSEINTYNGMIAIGKPFDGIRMLVVDELNNEVKTGEKGELLMSGNQVSSGYLNNEKKNASSYILLNEGINKTFFYRSGDSCYKDENGNIHYCGRLDSQVKIQGFRIELSEIEICVKSISKLNNVVITKKNKVDALELILVLETNENYDETALAKKMKEKLPEYMLPSSVYVLREFPLNSSGKTDRVQIKLLLNAKSSGHSFT